MPYGYARGIQERYEGSEAGAEGKGGTYSGKRQPAKPRIVREPTVVANHPPSKPPIEPVMPAQIRCISPEGK